MLFEKFLVCLSVQTIFGSHWPLLVRHINLRPLLVFVCLLLLLCVVVVVVLSDMESCLS